MQIPVIQPWLRSSSINMLILFLIAMNVGGGYIAIGTLFTPPSIGKAAGISSVAFMILLSNMATYYLFGLNKLGPNWQILFQVYAGVVVFAMLGFAYCNSSPAAFDRCMKNRTFRHYFEHSALDLSVFHFA